MNIPDSAKGNRRLATVLLLLTLPTTTIFAADSYTVTDLGSNGPFGMNNVGDVVGSGSASFGGPIHACVWHGTNRVDLGTLGGPSSSGQAINDNGDVVGYSDLTNGGSHAFLYSGGIMKDLGTLDGSTDPAVQSVAKAINALGQVVGYSYTSSGSVRAFLYSAGNMTDLGTLGGTNANANAINDKGEIAGGAGTEGPSHGFLFTEGIMKDLGTLGGQGSGATAINNSGDVVGTSDMIDGSHHAYLYSGGIMTDIGVSLTNNSFASAINNKGQVVGYFQTNGFVGFRPFLYSNGQLFNLENLALMPAGYTLNQALAINDQGWILCSAIKLGRVSDFVLKPVVQAPPLNPALVGTSLVLSWSDSSYTLETSDRLGQNALWTPLTNGVVTSGTTSHFTNSVLNAVGFFRLRK